VVIIAGATAAVVRSRRVDDVALAKAFVGTWTAVDPNDASLHRRDVPVSREQIVALADGTLTHVIELASKPGSPERDHWDWKIKKGRLYVRFLGDDASGQWLPGFAFSVTDKAMSIRIKDRPAKQWLRD